MATRYFVIQPVGSDSWDNTNNWSASSGGARGASVPTSADDVIFDSNSNNGKASFTVSLSSSSTARNVTVTLGVPCVWTVTTSSANFYGSFINNNTNLSFAVGSAAFNLRGSASSSFTIKTSGVTIPSLRINAPSGCTYTLTDNTTVTAGIGNYLGSGTLDIGSYTVTTRSFDLASGTTLLSSGATININTSANFYFTSQALFPYYSTATPTAANFGTFTGTATVNINSTQTSSSSVVTLAVWGWSGMNLNIQGTYSNGNTLALSGSSCNNLNFTGFTGPWTYISGQSNSYMDIYGDLTIPSTTTSFNWSSDIFVRFRKTSGTQTITTGGNQLGMPIVFGEASTTTGTTFTLADNFSTQIVQPNANKVELIAGTLNANNKNVSVGIFKSSNSNVRTITMGSGTWTLSSGSDSFSSPSWDLSTSTNLTLNANTSTIVWSGTGTSTTSKTFNGGGLTYNNLTISGGTGIATYTFSGNNTFSTISYTKTVAGTFKFTSGSTTTVSTWSVNGTSTAPITINSTSAGSPATLVKSGAATINMSYTSIQDSTASPLNTWYSLILNNNTNLGNNNGWIFNQGAFFALF